MEKVILSVKDLAISFTTSAGEIQAVRGVSFEVAEGETLAIVGESGCGKSVTAQAVMRLNPTPPAIVKSGEITLDGIEILKLDEKQMEYVRGSVVSMVFQDPLSSLNPTMPIGNQICEALPNNRKPGRETLRNKAAELLKLVHIPNAGRRARQYPHEFSGGMRQRAMIAMALANSPRLMILDEPATALDATVQTQILELIKNIRDTTSTSILLITHDLGMVAGLAQKIIVMYAGKIVETGTAGEIFYNPRHPYTLGLLKSIPRLDQDKGQALCPIEGTPPDLLSPPSGCAFADRCGYCMNICLEAEPEMYDVANHHTCACFLFHPEAPCRTANV